MRQARRRSTEAFGRGTREMRSRQGGRDTRLSSKAVGAMPCTTSGKVSHKVRELAEGECA